MCRHAAWFGPVRPLSWLISEPEYGLLRQSYAPRMQRYGTVNADGFGVGWYDSALSEPVRYRRTVPIWSDANLTGLAAAARSTCLIAAVRSATVGMPIEETATAPFADGRWLLSHNGRIERDAVRRLAADLGSGLEPGDPREQASLREPESACGPESRCESRCGPGDFGEFEGPDAFESHGEPESRGEPESLGEPMAPCEPESTCEPESRCEPESTCEPESLCDSAWLASFVFTRLRTGTPLADALALVVKRAAAADPAARLNLLACGGSEVAAVAWGDTLYAHVGEGVLVASEPLDDRPGWRPVPDRNLLFASPDGVLVTPIR